MGPSERRRHDVNLAHQLELFVASVIISYVSGCRRKEGRKEEPFFLKTKFVRQKADGVILLKYLYGKLWEWILQIGCSVEENSSSLMLKKADPI